tara:strand:+ start:509 stop:622 length:114 start_codon:yes stop_codon:yes gene_type:complete
VVKVAVEKVVGTEEVEERDVQEEMVGVKVEKVVKEEV